MVEVVRRDSARVLVIDEHDRVLLFHGSDPAVSDAPLWWFSAGGGLNDGERPEDAARREVFEETGIAVDEVVGPLWTRDTEFGFLGKHYVVHEIYFLARVRAVTVDMSGCETYETDSIHTYRWWSVDELRASDETIYPPGLADLLARVLRDGPPAEVAVID